MTYSVADAASVLGVSRSTIYRLLYRGFLSAVPGLRHKLIARSSVVDYVEQGGRRHA
jgi:excisionase family DNA binding protein